MAKETFTFQAEVGKILDIVAHSLYSEKEVFFATLPIIYQAYKRKWKITESIS